MKYALLLFMSTVFLTHQNFAQFSTSSPGGSSDVYTNGHVNLTGNGKTLIFQNTASSTATTEGLTWSSSGPTDYGVHRTSGTWDSPNYQQLRVGWLTGIILDPGTTYGKSYVDIKGNGLRVTAGKVGIGTTTPGSLLSFGSAFGNNKLALYETSSNTNKMGFGVQANQFRIHLDGSGSKFSFLDAEAGNVVMNLTGSGRLSLGVDSTPTGYKLAVNGKVIAEELKISLKNDWPDYVFERVYTLRSLEELEAYLNANGHLPNIPSAEEVKNDGGIELGQMNAKLLEKIEELTLYMIQERKERIKLEKEIRSLKNRRH